MTDRTIQLSDGSDFEEDENNEDAFKMSALGMEEILDSKNEMSAA
jgi:hypothetical protein